MFAVAADEWTPAVEGLTDRTSLVIRNLSTGDRLQFRVRAYNMAGPSPAATLAQPVTVREIMRERLGRVAVQPAASRLPRSPVPSAFVPKSGRRFCSRGTCVRLSSGGSGTR